MPDENGYYLPVQYQPLWFILALVLVLLVVGWYVFVWWYAKRKHRPKQTPPGFGDRGSVEELREKYFRLIDEVEEAFATGELTNRTAHQRLGVLVRSYAWESRGVQAQPMTLDDLERAQLEAVADAVELYYPAEFAQIERGDVGRSATAAREVVGAWQ